jgi:hypothetical protein
MSSLVGPEIENFSRCLAIVLENRLYHDKHNNEEGRTDIPSRMRNKGSTRLKLKRWGRGEEGLIGKRRQEMENTVASPGALFINLEDVWAVLKFH